MATTTKRRTSSSGSRSKFEGALGLLHHDHQEVEKLFKAFEEGPSLDIGRQICQEMTVHAELEESTFYPECQGLGGEFSHLVMEAQEEHRQVKELVRAMEGASDVDEQYEARMKVMQDDVLHHVEEEEKELFPKVTKAMGKDRLEQLGKTMEENKMRLMGTMSRPGDQRVREEVREAHHARR